MNSILRALVRRSWTATSAAGLLVGMLVLPATSSGDVPTTFAVLGSTLRVTGGIGSSLGGNAIYLYNENGGSELVVFDIGMSFVAGPGCTFDPDDDYIHCDGSGVTTFDIRFGDNAQNSAIVAFTFPNITKVKVRGSDGNDSFATNGSVEARLPNLKTFTADMGAGDDQVHLEDPASSSSSSLLPTPLKTSIKGGEGNDTIVTGPSRDKVDGGPGFDTIMTGAGNDRIKARDGVADSIDCGDNPPGSPPDTDTVTGDSADMPFTGCERINAR